MRIELKQVLGAVVCALSAVWTAGCGGSGGSASCGVICNGGGSSNPTTVTLTITGSAPTAVATRVGSGAFTSANASAGTITLELSGGAKSFAFAYACPPITVPAGSTTSTFQYEYALEATTDDGNSFFGACGPSPVGSTGTLVASLDASAIPNAALFNIYAQNGSQQANGYIGSNVGSSSFAAPLGNDRVLVAAYSSELIGGYEQTFTMVAARNFASQTVPGSLNNGDVVVLGSSDQITSQSLAYTNIPSGYGSPTTISSINLGGNGGLLMANLLTDSYPIVPAAVLQSGDFYILSSTDRNSSNATEAVSVETLSNSGGPLTVAFPSPWTYAGPNPAALPAFQMSYGGFSGTTNVLDYVTIDSIPSGANHNILEVAATANSMGSSSTLATPDLSKISGFFPNPASGTLETWGAGIQKASYNFFQAKQPTTGTISVVSNGGVLAVP